MAFRSCGVPALVSVGAVATVVPLWRRVFGDSKTHHHECHLTPDEQRKAIERNRTGVIVCNIGSPASTKTSDVRSYLGKFLGDDRVLDITPAWKKWLVLKIILLVRPKESAATYAEIWDEKRGSPLIYYTEELVNGLQEKLGDDYNVQAGMSYSDPDIATVMKKFNDEGISKVVVVPNYPNYASSTCGSTLQDVYHAASKSYVVPNLAVVPPWFKQPGFLKIWAKNIHQTIGEDRSGAEHLVISFHGVPERHCTGCDKMGEHCNKSPDCCAQLIGANKDCYRAQCFETARRIAKEANLPDDYWSISFQSRLTLRDRIKWIEPYTDVNLQELGEAGRKKVAVCAPSFAIDCLETLHELKIENLENFQEAGGDELVYIPCPNSHPDWVDSLAKLVEEARPKDLSW